MPKRKGAGRPPRSNPLLRVKELLPKNGTPISQIELRNKVSTLYETKGKGMSMKTLHKYLNKLVKTKQISKEWIEDPYRGRPIVHYRLLLDKFFPVGKGFDDKFINDADLAFLLSLSRDKLQGHNKESIVFLKITYWIMNWFLGSVLKEASYEDSPEAASDFIDVVLKIHLLPWLHKLAIAGQSVGGLTAEPIVSVFYHMPEEEALTEFTQICERNSSAFDEMIENLQEINILGQSAILLGLTVAKDFDELNPKDQRELYQRVIREAIKRGIKIEGKNLAELYKKIKEIEPQKWEKLKAMMHKDKEN